MSSVTVELESGGASVVPSTSVRRRGSCFTEAAEFAEHTFVRDCAAARDRSTRYAAFDAPMLKTPRRNSITASESTTSHERVNVNSSRTELIIVQCT